MQTTDGVTQSVKIKFAKYYPTYLSKKMQICKAASHLLDFDGAFASCLAVWRTLKPIIVQEFEGLVK